MGGGKETLFWGAGEIYIFLGGDLEEELLSRCPNGENKNKSNPTQ